MQSLNDHSSNTYENPMKPMKRYIVNIADRTLENVTAMVGLWLHFMTMLNKFLYMLLMDDTYVVASGDAGSREQGDVTKSMLTSDSSFSSSFFSVCSDS